MGPAGPGLFTDLTHVDILGWEHGQGNQQLTPVVGANGVLDVGVVLSLDNGVQFETVDSAHVYQVLCTDPGTPGFQEGFRCLCPVLGTVWPVRNFTVAGGIITQATLDNPVPGMVTRGLAFLFSQVPGAGPMSVIGRRIINGQIPELWVRLRGDFVIDSNGNAVAGSFLRAQLPSGDHRLGGMPPPNDPLSLQGGLFESWFGLSSDPQRPRNPDDGGGIVGGGRPPIHINTATAEELREIDGIGRLMARRILRARREAPFRDEADLRERVPQLVDDVLERIRDRLRFDE
jgi:hypothetical protein